MRAGGWKGLKPSSSAFDYYIDYGTEYSPDITKAVSLTLNDTGFIDTDSKGNDVVRAKAGLFDGKMPTITIGQ